MLNLLCYCYVLFEVAICIYIISIVSLGLLYEAFVLFIKSGGGPLLLKSGGAIAPLAPPIATPMDVAITL